MDPGYCQTARRWCDLAGSTVKSKWIPQTFRAARRLSCTLDGVLDPRKRRSARVTVPGKRFFSSFFFPLAKVSLYIIYIYDHLCIYSYVYIHTLHYITLHYITLHYITLHYITLHYITLHYITLHYITYIHTYIHMYICKCNYHLSADGLFHIGNNALPKNTLTHMSELWCGLGDVVTSEPWDSAPRRSSRSMPSPRTWHQDRFAESDSRNAGWRGGGLGLGALEVVGDYPRMWSCLSLCLYVNLLTLTSRNSHLGVGGVQSFLSQYCRFCFNAANQSAAAQEFYRC